MSEKYLLIIISFLFTFIFACGYSNDRKVHCVVKNGFKGELFIIANGIKADEPNP